MHMGKMLEVLFPRSQEGAPLLPVVQLGSTCKYSTSTYVYDVFPVDIMSDTEGERLDVCWRIWRARFRPRWKQLNVL